jgi:mutator protein MutT
MNPAGDHPPKDRPLPPNVVEVSAALIFQCGKILLTQRPPGSHLAGLWEFPGGKREPLETFEQCLVREIREELGITIAVGRLFDSISHQYPQKSVLLKFFVCRLLAGVPRPLACAQWVWANPEELNAYSFPAADRQLLEKLRNSPAVWQNDPDSILKTSGSPGN